MPICLPNCQSVYSAEVWMEATKMSQCLRTCKENACGTRQIMYLVLRRMGWDGLATSSNALTVSCGFAKSIDSLATDVSLINSCGRMTSCKKYGSLLSFSSFWEAKSAHSLGKMLSRNELHLSHNSIKDHGIYKADFRTLLVNRLRWGICSAYAVLRRFCNTYYWGG